MFQVNEIFHSLQGEGSRTGRATHFIRFSGCNLACSWCDTQHQAHQVLALEQLLVLPLWQEKDSGVCLTGGEPLLQPLYELLSRLTVDQRERVQIETNGTLLKERWWGPGVGLITVSPKCAFEEAEQVLAGLRMLESIEHPYELKLVVWDERWCRPWIDWALNVSKMPVVYVQPRSCDKESTELCVQQVKRWNHSSVRLSLQQQKILAIR